MRQRSSLLLASAGFAAFVALGTWACGSGSSPQVHEVVIDATSYSPQILDVGVGDTIVWTNKDLLVHTVTAENGEFDSGDMAPDETWRFTVQRTGEFVYRCVYHPPMTGHVRVQ